MNMKRSIQFIVLLFVMALFGLTNYCLAEEMQAIKAPKAIIAKPDYEFKPVPEGTNVVHDFIIRNEGDDTLVITKVKPG